jgi:hypothetical protein
VNVARTIHHIVKERNNTKDEVHIELVGDTTLKIVYDAKWINDYSTGYELGEESSYSIKRIHDESFYETNSKCPKLFDDINKV